MVMVAVLLILIFAVFLFKKPGLNEPEALLREFVVRRKSEEA